MGEQRRINGELATTWFGLLIREEHRMMSGEENENLRIEGNRCGRGSYSQIQFHQMIIEGHSYQSVTPINEKDRA